MLSAQTPSQEWSTRPALLIPSCLLSSQASVPLHWERVTVVLPPAAVPARACSLLRNRFQARRPTSPALLPGQRAAPSTDMLLGTAVKSVSLSLRLFPQAQPRFSLRQRGCPGKEAFAVCGFLPPRDWAQASRSSPQNISQPMMCFRRGFGLERTALRFCFLIKASVASGKKSCGRAGASWALLSRVPCSCPGFTLPGRTKQIQPQPCSSLHSLGWHSLQTTISQCRHRLAFYSGAQSDSRTRLVLSPQEWRGDRIHAHRPCTE